MVEEWRTGLKQQITRYPTPCLLLTCLLLLQGFVLAEASGGGVLILVERILWSLPLILIPIGIISIRQYASSDWSD